MNAQKFLAAAALIVAAGSAFAGDAPAPVAASVAATVVETNLNLPTVSVTAVRNRADVRAEAVEFVKNYKTTLAVQLEQYKN